MNEFVRKSRSTPLSNVSFTEIANNKSHDLYVINNTARSRDLEPGTIAFVVQSEGETVAIQIPLTWVPINIATQAPREDIIKSRNFRLNVTRGWLKLISDEEALKMLESEDAQMEWDHAQMLISGSRLNDARIEDGEEKETQYNPILEKVSPVIHEAITRPDITVNEQLSMVMQRKNLGLLTVDEERYIMDNSAFDKVKAFLTHQ